MEIKMKNSALLFTQTVE